MTHYTCSKTNPKSSKSSFGKEWDKKKLKVRRRLQKKKRLIWRNQLSPNQSWIKLLVHQSNLLNRKLRWLIWLTFQHQRHFKSFSLHQNLRIILLSSSQPLKLLNKLVTLTVYLVYTVTANSRTKTITKSLALSSQIFKVLLSHKWLQPSSKCFKCSNSCSKSNSSFRRNNIITSNLSNNSSITNNSLCRCSNFKRHSFSSLSSIKEIRTLLEHFNPPLKQ